LILNINTYAARSICHLNSKPDLTNEAIELYTYYYSPLVTRILMYEKIPYVKKDFKIERIITYDNKIVSILKMDFKVSGNFTTRKIKGTGFLNNHQIQFNNKTKANIVSQKATFNNQLLLEKQEILDVQTELFKNTSKTSVEGNILNQPISYETILRDSNGKFAGKSYNMTVQGIYKTAAKQNLVKILMKGRLGDENLIGEANKITNNSYKLTEKYGDYSIASTFTFI
jgi:hypothetical protein